MLKRNCLVVVAVAAIVCLIGSTAQSAVPSLMNYGGILTNGGGAPQVGTFNVTFTVYDAATGGTALWSEVQSVTTDEQGRFNVLLGSSAPLVDSVFRGPDRYLGITVSPDPEMSARARISTVGFAFRAAMLDHATITDNNTIVGWDAGASTVAGNGTTAIGAKALRTNTTAVANTACGAAALELNTVGTNNTATGIAALNSNTGHLNTANGAYALRINNGDFNVAVGNQALEFSSGSENTAIGAMALVNYGGGSGGNTAIGYYAQVSDFSVTNATALGAHAFVNASNKIRLGDPNITVIEGEVAYTFTSDKNSKENFREVDGDEVLAKLRDMDVQSWNYKGHDPEHFRHYGPVAQDFYAAFGKDDLGTVGTPTTINSGDMAGILMIAVQALEKRTAENDELKARIEALEKLVKEQFAASKDQ